MEVEKIKEEIEKVIEEIQDFTKFSPNGEVDSIEYLYTAREVANCYDRIMTSNLDEKTLKEITYLRHCLKQNPQYLSFHK
ncbi:MAG: hypothetical protein IKF83_02280 [Clostridia bacterium]|nr:hypothetical protein [Clostridia bacterium]